MEMLIRWLSRGRAGQWTCSSIQVAGQDKREESQEGTWQVIESLQVSPSGYMDAVQVSSYQLLICFF